MITPGIYLDMAASDYFADPAPEPSLTQSIAKVLIEQSPAHAWLAHPRLGGSTARDEGYDKKLAIGNAAHKLVLGRGKEVVIIEANDFRTKDAQQTRDAIAAEGKVPILAKHHKQAREMCGAIKWQLAMTPGCENEKAFSRGDGNSEVVLIARDESGIWLRSMVDWMCSPRVLYDLKTGGMSASPYAIPSRMVDAGWDVQAAMQERILNILDPEGAGRRTFRFVAVENEPPYALTVNELSESVMTMGRKKLQYAIDMWSTCMASGKWPAYPPKIFRPEYPGYLENQWLEREGVEWDARQAEKRAAKPTITGADALMAG